MKTKSTKSVRSSKPKKPYPEFPLFPHATGRWAKKIRQKLHYFGKIADDPEGKRALEQFNREWPYLADGRTPPPLDSDACTIRELCNAFLISKRVKMDAGELSERSWSDYYKTCDAIVKHFGRSRRVDDLRPDDFQRFRSELAKRMAPVTLRNEITRCRSVFKYAFDQRLIDRPCHYGQSFARPSAKMLRKARNAAGVRMFEADEIKRMLDAADPILKAMILLACNGGLGNSDIASLPQSSINFQGGWLDYPRPKTEIPRRIPLWAETVEALREAIAIRPKAKEQSDGDLCFLTKYGKRWVRVRESVKKAPNNENQQAKDQKRYTPLDALGQRFAKLLKELDINGERGFYCFRRTFETIAGESKDQVAVDSIMGHVDSSMAAVYRQRVSDERLRAVVNVMHDWLWPEDETGSDKREEGD